MQKATLSATRSSKKQPLQTLTKRQVTRNPNQSKKPKFTDRPLTKSSSKASFVRQSANRPSTVFGLDPKPHESDGAAGNDGEAKPRSKFAAKQRTTTTHHTSSTQDAIYEKTPHPQDTFGLTNAPFPDLVWDTGTKLRSEFSLTHPRLCLGVASSMMDEHRKRTDDELLPHDHTQKRYSTEEIEQINKAQNAIENSVRVSTLSNGIKIVTASDKKNKFTALTLSVDMGPQYEELGTATEQVQGQRLIGDEDKKTKVKSKYDRPIFRGITGAYAHMLNNILQNPNSDVEYADLKRQMRKREILLKEMITRLGADNVTDEMIARITEIRFQSRDEKNAEKAARKAAKAQALEGENLLTTEFNRHVDVQKSTVQGSYPLTPSTPQPVVKKTWREQLRAGSLPHTKWFVEPHKEHLTISAYTDDDKIVKILKTLSLILLHPDFNKDDFRLAYENIKSYWNFNLEEESQAMMDGAKAKDLQSISDLEALSALSQNLISKASFTDESSHRGPYQPLPKIMRHFTPEDITKWHKLFFHSQSDPKFLTKHPLTISITGVNNDNDHANIVTMCQQLFGGLYSRDEPFIRSKVSAQEHQQRIKPGSFLSSTSTRLPKSAEDDENAAKETRPEPNSPLPKREQHRDEVNFFSPSIWDSASNSHAFYHPRYAGRMPSMVFTWEDASEMALAQYAPQTLLNKTSFKTRLQKDKGGGEKQNESHIAPGALTAIKFSPKNAGFTHTPLHSTIIKHLFGVYAPVAGVGHGETTLSREVLARALPAEPRMIIPLTLSLNNSSIFSLAMTISRSIHAESARDELLSKIIPHISQFVTAERLSVAKDATISELLESQRLAPSYLSSLPSPTMGNYGTEETLRNSSSFFGNEFLQYPKQLARQTQLFNSYVTPAMIKQTQAITLEEIKDVMDNVFKGSTRHDPPEIQALKPIHPGIVLLGVQDDTYSSEQAVRRMLATGSTMEDVEATLELAERYLQREHDELNEEAERLEHQKAEIDQGLEQLLMDKGE